MKTLATSMEKLKKEQTSAAQPMKRMAATIPSGPAKLASTPSRPQSVTLGATGVAKSSPAVVTKQEVGNVLEHFSFSAVIYNGMLDCEFVYCWCQCYLIS